ncbi:MaoC family dehydratase [Limnobacter humi]|uniref:MaoC family dehydratase n=1 Tax=Limnobacter humi TaxID=1778671 RepID=A0ABT1WFU8_9BURK|nr:MaoC family dehydratase [Limnobacter humi]MCQ8896397.1 MaoC family dehydratase [Limnobacter humi]
MQLDYPVKYLVHHLANIRSMGMAAVRNSNPLTRPASLPQLPVNLEQSIQPMPNALIDSYVQWSGADPERYTAHVPAHFCSHFAMPLLANLGSLAPYNLLALLNQGVRIEILKPVERDRPLHLSGSLMDVSVEPDRVRIHTQVRVLNAQHELSMVIDSYSTVPQGKPSQRKSNKPTDDATAFTTVGSWSAEFHDGLNFAMLTGDFNPIHTWPAVGRRSRFKTLILHGFGQLARTFECVQNIGYTIVGLDVRWIKPLTLPNANLSVQVGERADIDGWRGIRLLASDGSVHMVGRFLGKGA